MYSVWFAKRLQLLEHNFVASFPFCCYLAYFVGVLCLECQGNVKSQLINYILTLRITTAAFLAQKQENRSKTAKPKIPMTLPKMASLVNQALIPLSSAMIFITVNVMAHQQVYQFRLPL